MQKLNYEADGKGKGAEEYLKKHNYFEDDSKKGGQK